MTQLEIWSLERLAELWLVKRDLKISDLSSIFWTERLVAEVLLLVELEDGPATSKIKKKSTAK